MTGDNYNLFYKGKSKHKSVFGGIFSITLYMFLLYFTINILFGFINMKKFNSCYNYFYLTNNYNYKNVSFSNDKPLIFKIKQQMIIPLKEIIPLDNYYKLAIQFTPSHFYVLPKCLNQTSENSSYCFNLDNFTDNQLDQIQKITLLPCAEMKNVINPEEIKNCKSNYSDYDKYVKNTLRNNYLYYIGIESYLNSLNINNEKSDRDMIDRAKLINYEYLIFQKIHRISTRLELTIVNYIRNDLLFGFNKVHKYLNFLNEETVLDEGVYAFGFEYYFKRRTGNNFHIVHFYEIKYEGILEMLSNIGGFMKIINILCNMFRFFISRNLKYKFMFYDFNIDSSYDKEGYDMINYNKIDIFKYDKNNLLINSSHDITKNNKNPKKHKLTLSCISCLYISRKYRNQIKNIFSYQSIFTKMKEIFLLKRLILDKGNIYMMNNISKSDNYKLNNKFNKELLEDYSDYSGDYIKSVEPNLLSYDKRLLKYLI